MTRPFTDRPMIVQVYLPVAACAPSKSTSNRTTAYAIIQFSERASARNRNVGEAMCFMESGVNFAFGLSAFVINLSA